MEKSLQYSAFVVNANLIEIYQTVYASYEIWYFKNTYHVYPELNDDQNPVFL